MFTERDNETFAKIPDEKEIKQVLDTSNLLATPGTDCTPSLLYQECWPILKNKFTEVIQAIFSGEKPTLSMRTSIMVFGSKPKKIRSLKTGDKRLISLLNSDFKLSLE